MKEGTGSFASVSVAFGPVGPIHPVNPGSGIPIRDEQDGIGAKSSSAPCARSQRDQPGDATASLISGSFSRSRSASTSCSSISMMSILFSPDLWAMSKKSSRRCRASALRRRSLLAGTVQHRHRDGTVCRHSRRPCCLLQVCPCDTSASVGTLCFSASLRDKLDCNVETALS